MTGQKGWRHCLSGLLVLLMMTSLSAGAIQREIVFDETYCFCDEDFSTADASAAAEGILLTDVPAQEIGVIRLGSRTLRAGDALSAGDLTRMEFVSTSAGDVTAEIRWIPVYSGNAAREEALHIAVGNGKNTPPTAEPCRIETYRNIAIDGKIRITDPDDTEFTCTVSKPPKRGSASINPDGTFNYTPLKNKVGKDTFTVEITDSAGNSCMATVEVVISKPTDKAAFADMRSDPDQYFAMWLKDQGVYQGQVISGTRLFQPNQEITRGEFLVMCMDLLDIEPDRTALTTGFADEEETPAWMRPYIVTALRGGYITGSETPQGLCFRYAAPISQAEAAVILSRMLGQNPNAAVGVFSADETVPAWVQSAISCLSSYGISGLEPMAAPMTMRHTASLLYQVYQAVHSDALSGSLLSWAADA